MNGNVDACAFCDLRGTGKGLKTTDLGYVCVGSIQKKECKYRAPLQTLYYELTILLSTVQWFSYVDTNIEINTSLTT